MDYVSVIILFAIGLLLTVKPELLWKLERIITIKTGEPSELYLKLTRFSGAVLVLISLFWVVSAVL